MKKHLIAAAVAAAVAVPAMAQVTVYGVMDVSVTSASKSGAASSTTGATSANSVSKVNSSLLTTSRLGFRGEEDLGGGLKGGFIIESEINNDAARALSLGDRGSELFVSGAFGQIRFGKANTSDANTVHAGPTNLTNLGTSLTGTRPDNRVQYITPSFNGFTANVAFGSGSESEDGRIKKDGDYTNIGAAYTNGPLRLVAFQATAKVQSATVTAKPALCAADANGATSIGATGDDDTCAATGFYTVIPAVVGAAAQDGKVKDTGLMASYNFGVAQASLRYIKNTVSGAVNAPTSGITRTSLDDRKAYAVDVIVPLGGGITLGAGYVDVDVKAANYDYKRYAAYVSKDLSKRTNIYAAYQQTKNETSSRAFGASQAAVDADADPKVFGVGLRHSF